MPKKRKWKDSYVQFEFTCTERYEGLQKPQCMFCNTVFSNAYLKKSELQDYFKNRNGGATVSEYNDKSLKPKRILFE